MGCGLSRGPANGSGDATTKAGAISSAVAPYAAHVPSLSKRITLEMTGLGEAGRTSEALTASTDSSKRRSSLTTTSTAVRPRESMASSFTVHRTGLSTSRSSNMASGTSSRVTRSTETATKESGQVTTSATSTLSKNVKRVSSRTSCTSSRLGVSTEKGRATEAYTNVAATKTARKTPSESRPSSAKSVAPIVSYKTSAVTLPTSQTSNSKVSSVYCSGHSRSGKLVSTTMTTATPAESGTRNAKSSSSLRSDASSRLKAATKVVTGSKEYVPCKPVVNRAREKTPKTSPSINSDISSLLTKSSSDRTPSENSRLSKTSLTSQGEKRVAASSSKKPSVSSGRFTKTAEGFSKTLSSSKALHTSGGVVKTSQDVSTSAQSRRSKILSTSARSSDVAAISSTTSSTVSSVTGSSEGAPKLDRSSRLPATSIGIKTAFQRGSSLIQSVVKVPNSSVNRQNSTVNCLKAGRENEILTKPRNAKVCEVTKSSDVTESCSKSSPAATRLSNASKDERNLTMTPVSESSLIRCHLNGISYVTEDEGSSTETSESESTLVPSVRLNIQTSGPKTAPKKSSVSSTNAPSCSSTLEKTSKQEQGTITGTYMASESSSVSDKGSEEVGTETITDSASDDTSAPTCTASSWERSGNSSTASAPLVAVNSVQFFNCNDTSDVMDIADDCEDFYFRPASWCRSELAVGSGRCATSSVVLNVRRARQTTMSAHEAYLQYWVSSWPLAAPSDSESSVSDDDGCGHGDAPLSEKNDSATTDASTRHHEAVVESKTILGTGDAPCTAAKEKYSDDPCRLQDGTSSTSMSESTYSLNNQQPASVSVRNNINNSAVVGSMASDFWELASGIGDSRASSTVLDGGALLPLPTSSCLVLDSARVNGGQLQLKYNVNNEPEPEIWKLQCQQVIKEYELSRGSPANAGNSSEVHFSGALNSGFTGVKDGACDTDRDNRDDGPIFHNTKKIMDQEISDKQSSVVPSWSYVERVERGEKVERLAHDFTGTKVTLQTTVHHNHKELRHSVLTPLPQSYQAGVVSWKQPMQDLPGAVKGKDFPEVSSQVFHADDVWTKDINDIDADSGYASRSTVSQLTSGLANKPLSRPMEELVEKARTVAAQQHDMYAPEVADDKFENTNSIEDDDFSESVAAIANYRDYDVVASFEQLEDPNSIDDLTGCVSPSTESDLPLLSLKEMNAVATSGSSNSYTALGLHIIGRAGGAVLSDNTVITNATAQAACGDAPLRMDTKKCSVPVARLQLKNDGLTAVFNVWCNSSGTEKSLAVGCQSISPGWDLSTYRELPPSDTLAPIYTTSPTRGHTLIETSVIATIESKNPKIRSKKDLAHEQRLSPQMAQKHVGDTALHGRTPLTASSTSIRSLTTSQRDRSPGCYSSPQGAGSTRKSTPSCNTMKSRVELECGTPERGSSQASASTFSPPRSSPSDNDRPSSGRLIESRGSPSPTPQLHAERLSQNTSYVLQDTISKPQPQVDRTSLCASHVLKDMIPMSPLQAGRTPPSTSQVLQNIMPMQHLQTERTPQGTSPLLQNMIRELSELQIGLRARIVAAEAARTQISRSSASTMAGVLPETEAADLVDAMASANALAEKLYSLVRQRRVKGIEQGAECARHTVNVTTSATTAVAVSVEMGTRQSHRNQGRSPPAPAMVYHE